MKIYDAIRQMRVMSRQGEPFALSYMTYSATRRKSHGERACEHAVLVKNPKQGRNAYTDHQLTYRDLDTGDVRTIWQPLLMTFEHIPLEF